MSISPHRRIVSADGASLFDPQAEDYRPIKDYRDRLSESSSHARIDPAESQLFARRRPRRPLSRQPSLGESQAPEAAAVVPHDSIGDFYIDGTLLFQTETAIYFFAVTPQFARGDNQQFLYLTATNRSNTGTESLIAYPGQAEAELRIWDWAVPAPGFVRTWSFAQLAPYYDQVTLAGTVFGGVFIANATRLLPNGQISNDTYLRMVGGAQYDHVYSYAYDRPQNPDNSIGFWGPIVETFQSFATPIDTMGFASAQLVQDGQHRMLTPDDVQFVGTGAGLEARLLSPYSTYLVP